MQCGAALQISVGCPLFNLTLTPSTWVTFHSLRVQPYKGSGAVASPGCYCTSHRLATRWRFQRPISNSECLYFWPTGYKSEVPTSLLLGLTELRETFDLLEHWRVIEGYNPETARWKRCLGQGVGKARHSASGLWCSPPTERSEPRPLWVLWRLHHKVRVD